MTTNRTRLVAAFLFLALALCPVARAQVPYRELKYPALNDFQVPQVDRTVLDNGLTLFLLEDRELPTVTLSAFVRFNVGDVPADKVGLANLTTQVMREGGTTSRTGDEIDLELDRRAAEIGFFAGTSLGGFTASSLTDQWDKVFPILMDILQNPAFPQDKIDLKKLEENSGIARRNDEPFPAAVREYRKLVYGADSPYARHTEYATIAAVTRDDLVAFHRTHFRPERMMVAVFGDFRLDEMKKKLVEAFGKLPRGEVPASKVPAATEAAGPRVNLIARPDVNQSVVLIGHLGGRMDNPDYFALEVLNQILGSGFVSRLFRRLRTEEGLAYSVFGFFQSAYDHEGLCYFGCSTKSENTVKAIKSLFREIGEVRKSEVTDEELATAKDMFLNSFVFNFDQRSKIIDRLMELEYFGYPADFLEITKKNIEKVTKADVRRVAEKYLQPDKMKILVLGNPQAFDGKLEEFGAVNPVDITIPGAPPAPAGGPGAAPVPAKGPAAPQAPQAQPAMGTAPGTGSTPAPASAATTQP
ncbi:MAG: insulinase family protein [Candidatus Riflebacteria bacterium]|nr:insulinase family protein [Candidatus Riflebacteria bacterium]